MQTLQSLRLIFETFMAIGFSFGFFMYGLSKGKKLADEKSIEPYRQAAKGWELASTQKDGDIKRLTHRVNELELEVNKIRAERDELKEDLIFAAKSNFKLQGEVDQLELRISSLEQTRRDNN